MQTNRVHHAFSDCQGVDIVIRFENDLFRSVLNRKNRRPVGRFTMIGITTFNKTLGRVGVCQK
jgi:hypothetical protein